MPWVGAGLLLLCVGTVDIARAATFIVNSTGDASDQIPGNGQCQVTPPPAGVCTLRAAIEEANASAGADVINFNITPSGVATIAPLTALPTITETVTINGTTQPPTGAPYIQIDATLAGANGLTLSGAGSNGSTIRGLVINRSPGNAIQILSSSNNIIAGNYLGTNTAASWALANAIGVFIQGTAAAPATGNRIGGIVAADRNVISGNTVDGVQMTGAGVTGSLVQGNRIGTNLAGSTAIANGRGVAILASASGNTIGGVAGSANVISGNTGVGVVIDASSGNTVSRNLIGTDVNGTLDLGNGQHGVQLSSAASGNTIGGATGVGNTISGNAQNGVIVTGAGTSANSILGNRIGLNVNGNATLRNDAYGVTIAQGASGNIVGDATGGNVISGNGQAGVRIFDNGTNNNLVQSNIIGLNAAGTLALPNSAQGVILDAPGLASGNRIGGVGLRNVISGNTLEGVYILNGMTGTLVVANYIGRNLSNTATIGNSYGVRIENASGNTIGGTGANEGNVIAGATDRDGVAIEGSGTGNAVLGNSIFGNNERGIDLINDGVTPNDVGDGDTGPNNLQNFPVLSAATTDGASFVHIAGSLNSAPSTAYRVEFFANTVADPGTGYGEAERYLGFTNVTTDAAGNTVVAVTLPVLVMAGEFISATATDPGSNTSELAQCITAVGDLVVTTTADTVDGTTTSVAALIANNGPDGRISLREAILATNATAGAQTIQFGIPLADANHLYYQNNGVSGLPAPTVTARADGDITDFDADYPAFTARSWYRIRPGSALPTVTGATTLDGTTQPGRTNRGPIVELDGSLAGAGVEGLAVTAGATTIRGLVVKRFTSNGMNLRGAGGFTVTGSHIGVDVSGTVASGNGSSGVLLANLSGTFSTIGGNTGATRNIISANGAYGVYVSNSVAPANSVQARVQGNYIGTDVTGTAGLGVQTRGIVLQYTGGHLIGGGGFGEYNVISGNAGPGIELNGNATGAGVGADNNVIQSNRIGTNANGTAAIANAGHGIWLYGTLDASSSASGNTIRSNVIAAASGGGHGIFVAGNADGNVIESNYIGTNSALASLGNTGSGIRVQSSPGFLATGNRVLSNTIRNNGADGVSILGDSSASLTQNLLFNNGGLGIDLADDGVTVNDGGDGDTGPNGLLNYPDLTSAYATGGSITVAYGLDVPAGSYRIEFFKNPGGVDPSGAGEGQNFATATTVTHPGGGLRPFVFVLAGATGDRLTATATYCTDGAACTAYGSTSEFSYYELTQPPTAVELLSFEAHGVEGGVNLTWETASELRNLGFHLHRAASPAGPYERITASLVPGLGSSPIGRAYSWLDAGLVNGTTYYYQLEDVDTASVSTFHGPVSAVAGATAPAPPGEGGGGDGAGGGGGELGDASCPAWVLAAAPEAVSPTCTKHGDPESVSLDVLSRTSSAATLELRTRGFWTLQDASGTVRVLVPGFDFPTDPKAPALPLRRALVDAVVGKQVELVSAEAFELQAFPGLRPSAAGAAEMAVGRDGTVRPARRSLPARFLSRGLVPAEVARLVGTAFQGERKSAVVEITPVRFDGSGQKLVLAGRVRVKLAFTGVADGESGTGSRGRALPRRGLLRDVLAQLHTSRRGLHAVRYEVLFSTNSRGLSTSLLRLQRQGEAVAFHVEPAGSVFGPGSVLYFFADRTATSTDYSSEVAYELVRGSGVPMGVARAQPAGAPVVSPSTGYASFETNRIYQPGLLEAPDVWLWDAMVSGAERTQGFTLSGVDASSPARLVVYVQGGSESGITADHHIRLSVNGGFVGEATFAGKQPYRLDMLVPASLLREGANELGVANVGDTGVNSLVFLDRFEVSYPQAATVRAGVFEGVWAESGSVEVGGFSGLPVILRDSRLPGPEGSAVKWVTGFAATGSSVRFQAEAGHRYAVVSPEGLLTPRVGRVPLSTLKAGTNQANYLVIAPREFLEAAGPLLERRRGQGLVSQAVSLEQIASEFGKGQPSAEAIKAFLSYAYHSWQRPSPRYVLLLGDATYDPQHFVASSWASPLPALWAKTSYLWTASDPALAAVNGDDPLPDLAIGRLPATTREQAEALVSKLLTWEDSGQGLSGNAVLVADNPDLGGDFEADVEDVRASYLSGRSTTTLKVSELGAGTRPAILGAFDEGASLMSYVGHGGTAVWASENVLNSWDAPSLLAQSRQPLLLTLNCLNGYFVASNFDALPESLLKAEGRGAIAAVSPSGLSLDGPAHQYHRAVVSELVSGCHERLGDAILAAQQAYAETGLMPELLLIYQLLGDPALKIR